MKNLFKIALILLLGSVSMKSFSQEWNIGIESGLGTFRMEDLKELNDVIIGSLPFNAAVTEEFPMYWYYKPSLTYKFSKTFTAGVVWSYTSTGSRISSKDYSGEYTFDNICRASSPGILFEAGIQSGKFEFKAFSEAGMEFTKLKLKQSVTLNTETQEDLYTFTSVNYYFEPGLRISYPVSAFRFSFNAGYLFDIKKGDFSYEGDDNQILVISDSSEARADWTGIRIGLSATFVLFQK